MQQQVGNGGLVGQNRLRISGACSASPALVTEPWGRRNPLELPNTLHPRADQLREASAFQAGYCGPRFTSCGRDHDQAAVGSKLHTASWIVSM